MSGYKLNRNGVNIVTPHVCATMTASLNCLLWDEPKNICT
jgi:hypothetical protein